MTPPLSIYTKSTYNRTRRLPKSAKTLGAPKGSEALVQETKPTNSPFLLITGPPASPWKKESQKQ